MREGVGVKNPISQNMAEIIST